MRISDWSSDVCSSDLSATSPRRSLRSRGMKVTINFDCTAEEARTFLGLPDVSPLNEKYVQATLNTMEGATNLEQMDKLLRSFSPLGEAGMRLFRSEEHTSELQSLMRISYAVFCL